MSELQKQLQQLFNRHGNAKSLPIDRELIIKILAHFENDTKTATRESVVDALEDVITAAEKYTTATDPKTALTLLTASRGGFYASVHPRPRKNT